MPNELETKETIVIAEQVEPAHPEPEPDRFEPLNTKLDAILEALQKRHAKNENVKEKVKEPEPESKPEPYIETEKPVERSEPEKIRRSFI